MWRVGVFATFEPCHAVYATEKSTYTHTLTVICPGKVSRISRCHELLSGNSLRATHCNEKRPDCVSSMSSLHVRVLCQNRCIDVCRRLRLHFLLHVRPVHEREHEENQWQNNPSSGPLNALALLGLGHLFPTRSVGLPKYCGQRPQNSEIPALRPTFFFQGQLLPRPKPQLTFLKLSLSKQMRELNAQLRPLQIFLEVVAENKAPEIQLWEMLQSVSKKLRESGESVDR